MLSDDSFGKNTFAVAAAIGKEANGGVAHGISNRQSEIDNQRSSEAIPLGAVWRTTSADKGLPYVRFLQAIGRSWGT